MSLLGAKVEIDPARVCDTGGEGEWLLNGSLLWPR